MAVGVVSVHQFSAVNLSELVPHHLKSVVLGEVNAGKAEPQLISVCLLWQLLKDKELNPF